MAVNITFEDDYNQILKRPFYEYIHIETDKYKLLAAKALRVYGSTSTVCKTCNNDEELFSVAITKKRKIARLSRQKHAYICSKCLRIIEMAPLDGDLKKIYG